MANDFKWRPGRASGSSVESVVRVSHTALTEPERLVDDALRDQQMPHAQYESIRRAVVMGHERLRVPQVAPVDQQMVETYKQGNVDALSTRAMGDLVRQGIVTKDVTVYRAGGVSSTEVQEFTLREDLALAQARLQRKGIVAVTLKAGSRALFVAGVTTEGLADVSVLVPPEYQVERSPYKTAARAL